MREIKFRARRLDNGEWAYGDLYQEKHPFENKLKETCIVEYRPDLCLVSGAPPNNHWWFLVDGKTVGQYTGLKDKNGKDIWEGDIVLIHGQESREVVFKHAFWMIENLVESKVLGGFGTPTDSGHKPIYRYGEEGMEVIGNIYQTPNLVANSEGSDTP